jgi:hypothetical protein
MSHYLGLNIPIVDTTTEVKMKNIPPSTFQTLMEW